MLVCSGSRCGLGSGGEAGRSDGVGDEKNVTILVSGQGHLNIDYLLYGPSPSWSAAGTTLLLDDQDEWTTFSEGWNRTSDATFPTGDAMKMTISQTSIVGSTFKARYVGQ
jgi:hypothetical protein